MLARYGDVTWHEALSTKLVTLGPMTATPARMPGPICDTVARVSVTRFPPLVKRHWMIGSTGLALLLFKYMTTCQRWPGTARSWGLSMLTMGTVGPAVIGTLPTGL